MTLRYIYYFYMKYCIFLHTHTKPQNILTEQSLGQWYNASLEDSDQSKQLKEETIKGFANIDKILAGSREVETLSLQFGLLPHLMWRQTIYEVPITKVEKLERTASTYIRKWLRLPHHLSNIGLYGNGALELTITSLTGEYKCSKVRLDMTLTRKPRMPQYGRQLPEWQQAESGTRLRQCSRQNPRMEILLSKCSMEDWLWASRPTWHRATPARRKEDNNACAVPSTARKASSL